MTKTSHEKKNHALIHVSNTVSPVKIIIGSITDP